MKFLDIFLLPKELYRRLNEDRTTLYLGIILVGLRDVGLYLGNRMPEFFAGKSQGILLQNAAVVLGFILLIGLIDVIFFSYPLYDLMKFIKRRQEEPGLEVSVIKLMKVYILANLVVTPIDIVMSVVLTRIGDTSVNPLLVAVLQLVLLATYFWYYAAITRGSSVLFNFRGVLKGWIFLIALLYGDLLNLAFRFIYEKGLMVLLK
ncbi:MAG: hypothetical protein N2484_18120 [Clostridia bacterium]|nr:hypothetical protein [Clostridia bacterium]